MKKTFLILSLVLTLFSCSKKEEVSEIQMQSSNGGSQIQTTLNLYRVYEKRTRIDYGGVITTYQWDFVEKETTVYSTNPIDENKIVPQTKYTNTSSTQYVGNIPRTTYIEYQAVLRR